MSTRPRTPGSRRARAPGKLPITELATLVERRQPIVMITAYDAPSGRLADEAGADLVLVGDSAAMTVLGHESTVPATMEEMLVLTRAVTRGARRPLVIADMPFGSFQVSDGAAVENAIRFVKDAGADAVKLEGAGPMLSRVRTIIGAGIPVMGHVGLTPQTATMLGGFKAQGRTADKAARLLADALALEEAGCFAVVLEAVPAPVADEVTRRLRIPTIGIGAGAGTDGQVLVWHDLLGLYDGQSPALREALRGPRDDDPRRRRSLRRGRPGAPVPGGGAHVRHVRRGARGVRVGRRCGRGRADGALADLRTQSASGRTANAATITPARSSAPTTPRQGRRKVVRRPSVTSAADHATNASPMRSRPRGPPLRPSLRPEPVVAEGDRDRRDEHEEGERERERGERHDCRAILKGGSTPTAFAPSSTTSPRRKYPAAP